MKRNASSGGWRSKNLSFRRTAILLTVGWPLLLVAIPHLLLLLTSVLTPDPDGIARLPFTLANYARTLEWRYFDIFMDSMWLSFAATFICLLVGWPLAWILSRQSALLRGLLLFLMIVPFWTNSLIRTYAIKLILGNRGLVNELLLSVELIDRPLQMLYSEGAVVLGLVYLLLPFMVLPLLASFQQIPPRILEAARDLGAGFGARMLHILLPMTLPGIVAGCLVVFLPAMGMFYVADLLGGARNLLLGNLIKNQFLLVRDWPFGSAVSLSLLLIMGLLLWLYYVSNRRLHRSGGLDDEVLH